MVTSQAFLAASSPLCWRWVGSNEELAFERGGGLQAVQSMPSMPEGLSQAGLAWQQSPNLSLAQVRLKNLFKQCKLINAKLQE